MNENKIKEKIAIIVGNGDLSSKIVNVAVEQELDFIIAGIKGSSPKVLVNSHNHFWFYMGEVSDFLSKLKIYNVKKIVFVGAINRPSLFSLKLDNLGKKFVQEYFSKISGDDSLLSIIIKEIESYGFEIIGAQDIDRSILSEKKTYTKFKPSEQQMLDIQKSFSIAKELSVFDIGQSAIFQQNMIIAIEAVEGTARMISRSKKLIKRNNLISKLTKIFFYNKNFIEESIEQKKSNSENNKLLGAFLVKIKKSHQEIRVDLPVIGDKTVKQAYKTGLVGIVIEAGATIIINEQKTIDLANKYGIFIIAL